MSCFSSAFLPLGRSRSTTKGLRSPTPPPLCPVSRVKKGVCSQEQSPSFTQSSRWTQQPSKQPKGLAFLPGAGRAAVPNCSPTTSPSSHRALPFFLVLDLRVALPNQWLGHSLPGRSSALGPSSPPVSP